MPELTHCPHILIVEDEWMLASVLEEDIRILGCEPVGPAPSVRKALDLLDREDISAAILDITLLDEEKSFPIAQALSERGIPYLFVTGYLKIDFPIELRGSMVISKPVARHTLAQHLTSLLAKSTPPPSAAA